jgi:acetyl/propionyl-CoA carboxylase alpha subunit
MPEVRVDAGVEEGDEVSVHYDPMIAKVIAWAPDRAAALERLQLALEATEVEGVRTNARFLWQILGAAPVRAGDVSTRLLESDAELGRGVPDDEIVDAWLLAAVARLHTLPGDRHGYAHAAATPWESTRGFRVDGPPVVRVPLRLDVQNALASVAQAERTRHWLAFEREVDGVNVGIDGKRHRVAVRPATPGRLEGHIDGRPVAAGFEVDHERVVVRRNCVRFDFVEDTGAEHRASAEHEGHFRAPMPGHVLDVRVTEGQEVAKGAVLLVLEAMKMEHSLTAPWPARVVEVKVRAGDRVEEGTDLARLEPTAG